MKSNKPEKQRPMTLKHILKIFGLYLLLAAAVAGWLEISSYDVFDPLGLLLGAIFTAVVATALHWHSNRRSRVDDIVDHDL
jgi:hypothetical protein